MTILNCQKRHHEPHRYYTPVSVNPWGTDWETVSCDGLPRWPYDRPKPPRDSMQSLEYGEYQKLHATIAVHNIGQDAWLVDRWAPVRDLYDEHEFRTQTEAITYAQKLAQERKQHGTRS